MLCAFIQMLGLTPTERAKVIDEHLSNVILMTAFVFVFVSAIYVIWG